MFERPAIREKITDAGVRTPGNPQRPRPDVLTRPGLGSRPSHTEPSVCGTHRGNMATVARARRTTPEHRAEVVAYAAEHGTPQAAQHYGHKAETIRSWCSRAGIATVAATESTRAATEARKATMEQRRTRLADRLLELAEMSTDAAAKLIGEASLRDLVGALDYGIKNSQLLSGQATARTETSREAIHARIDELAARRAA